MNPAGLALAATLVAGAAYGADAGSPVPTSPATSPAKTGGRLPEDPALGAKSTAQWRAFMAAEERERRLHFDRGRLKQHRLVLRALKQAQARYDRARTEAAVEAARARFAKTADEVRGRMAEIDHWGNNSNLLGDYDAILKLLASDYPSARLAAIRGRHADLDRLRADLLAREKTISAWLQEAATSRDE